MASDQHRQDVSEQYVTELVNRAQFGFEELGLYEQGEVLGQTALLVDMVDVPAELSGPDARRHLNRQVVAGLFRAASLSDLATMGCVDELRKSQEEWARKLSPEDLSLLGSLILPRSDDDPLTLAKIFGALRDSLAARYGEGQVSKRLSRLMVESPDEKRINLFWSYIVHSEAGLMSSIDGGDVVDSSTEAGSAKLSAERKHRRQVIDTDPVSSLVEMERRVDVTKIEGLRRLRDAELEDLSYMCLRICQNSVIEFEGLGQQRSIYWTQRASKILSRLVDIHQEDDSFVTAQQYESIRDYQVWSLQQAGDLEQFKMELQDLIAQYDPSLSQVHIWWTGWTLANRIRSAYGSVETSIGFLGIDESMRFTSDNQMTVEWGRPHVYVAYGSPQDLVDDLADFLVPDFNAEELVSAEWASSRRNEVLDASVQSSREEFNDVIFDLEIWTKNASIGDGFGVSFGIDNEFAQGAKMSVICDGDHTFRVCFYGGLRDQTILREFAATTNSQLSFGNELEISYHGGRFAESDDPPVQGTGNDAQSGEADGLVVSERTRRVSLDPKVILDHLCQQFPLRHLRVDELVKFLLEQGNDDQEFKMLVPGVECRTKNRFRVGDDGRLHTTAKERVYRDASANIIQRSVEQPVIAFRVADPGTSSAMKAEILHHFRDIFDSGQGGVMMAFGTKRLWSYFRT